jgi:hypothetical protein
MTLPAGSFSSYATGGALAEVRGSTVPRLYTPPLVIGPPGPCGCGCALTPDTSEGFDVIEAATDVFGRPPDPWQRWLYIHAMELLPDGRPRFRKVLVLVARQNGKTEALVILSAYWLFVAMVPLVLGTSTQIVYAKESWLKLVKLVEGCDALDRDHAERWTRQQNNEQECWTAPEGEPARSSRYKIAASNEEGGRSLTVHRLILDELRQHHSYAAWGAAVPAGNAVRDFQVWALSNAGDARSVVLNGLRAACVSYIETGEGEDRAGLFEWSAPDSADPQDVTALAAANPNLGYRLDTATLLSDAAAAVAAGGEQLTMFKTEAMCVNVPAVDPAIDPGKWLACLDPGTLAAVRDRVALCVDVAPDEQHATLAAAALLDDGRVRVELVKAWSGIACTDALRLALPGVVAKVRPRALGWFPNGPAAALAADLSTRRARRGWPPAGVTVDEIQGDVTAVCMGLNEQVTAVRLAHSADPLLDAQAGGAERLPYRGGWVFSRRDGAHVDALYAAAGAVHLARTLPSSVGRPRLVRARAAS